VSTPPPSGQTPEPEPVPHDEEAVVELLALAAIAVKGKLCSRLLPDYLACFQRDTGREPTAVSRRLAKMMKTVHDRGSHYTPEQVAGILSGCAGRIQRGGPMPEGFWNLD
jgi:hypothetical protein